MAGMSRTELMKNHKCQQWQRLLLGSRAGLTSLVMVLLVLGGCVPAGKVIPEPGAEEPAAIAETTVTHFEDGRIGFIIREPSQLDAASREIFAQSVELLQAGQVEQAIEQLTGLVELSPGVTAPHINLAMAYRQVEKPEQAEQQLRIALELLPGHPVASNEYGLLLRSAGRFSEAHEVYQQALANFPEYLPVRRNLGILCDLYLDDRECALTQYQLYSNQEPDDEQVKLWLTELSLRSGQ